MNALSKGLREREKKREKLAVKTKVDFKLPNLLVYICVPRIQLSLKKPHMIAFEKIIKKLAFNDVFPALCFI